MSSTVLQDEMLPAAPASQPVSPAAPEPTDALDAPTLTSLARELAEVKARLAALEAAIAPRAAAEPAPAATAGVLPRVEPAPVRRAEPIAEIREVLRAMFELALRPETSDQEEFASRFEQFRGFVHHSRRGSPLLDLELMNYKWRPLCSRVKAYLRDAGDPASFEIVQMAPQAVDDRTQSVKVFLRADKRMPPPVTMRRDDQAGGAFRIESTSL